ncbi:hypothetical protein H920_01254 [Fukomys damarensis]|uniref:Uncharacterized protein n=1 Tax=Fukomys damarensis TaxID=885580 RepID=A0A091DZ09_FUKDA|nr:hypothetical protein H920_01254 [Fukomys damarensis]
MLKNSVTICNMRCEEWAQDINGLPLEMRESPRDLEAQAQGVCMTVQGTPRSHTEDTQMSGDQAKSAGLSVWLSQSHRSYFRFRIDLLTQHKPELHPQVLLDSSLSTQVQGV